MRLFTIIILFLIGNLGYGHDLRMAIYEVSQEADGYKLDVSFDKDNFLRSLLTSYPELANNYSDKLLEKYISIYLQGNLALTFDSECSEINITSIHQGEDNIRVEAELKVEVDEVSQIRVFNTLMIDYNEGHLNIIRFKINNQVRAFKLSEKRVSTLVEY